MRFSSSIIETKGDIEALMDLFDIELTGYWADHGDFNTATPDPAARSSLSPASRELLIINVAAPLFYAYGSLTGDYDLAERGADILASLRPEKNSIIADWTRHGLKPHDAMRSQALMHLRSEYCDRDRCLDCRFGNFLLRNASANPDGRPAFKKFLSDNPTMP